MTKVGTTNKKKNLNAALQRLRRGGNVSVTELARMIGATRQTVHHWLNGRGISPVFRPHVEKITDRYIAKNGR